MAATPSAAAPATLKPDRVIIGDLALAAKLRNLGAGVDAEEGKPESELPLIEAAYFAEKGLLPLDSSAIMKAASKADKLAKEKLALIRFLRERGYITRVSLEPSDFLRVHRKGFRPGANRTYYLIRVVKEGWKPALGALEADMEFAGKMRKELAIAVINKEGRPMFVKLGRINFE